MSDFIKLHLFNGRDKEVVVRISDIRSVEGNENYYHKSYSRIILYNDVYFNVTESVPEIFKVIKGKESEDK